MKTKNGLIKSTIVIPFGGSACHIHVGMFVTLKLLSFNKVKNTSIRIVKARNTSIEVRRVWAEMFEIFVSLLVILSFVIFPVQANDIGIDMLHLNLLGCAKEHQRR
jgi:hypothetical protein